MGVRVRGDGGHGVCESFSTTFFSTTRTSRRRQRVSCRRNVHEEEDGGATATSRSGRGCGGMPHPSWALRLPSVPSPRLGRRVCHTESLLLE